MNASFFKEYAIFVIPIIVGVVTQIIKFIAFSLKHGWNPHYAFTHGHMPSSHTAFIVSLVTAIGYFAGMDSAAFAVSVVLAIIVIDDALRLRMYLGDQGRYLNMLIRQLDIDHNKFPRLKERVGHRLGEVIIGGILGLALTLLLIRLA